MKLSLLIITLLFSLTSLADYQEQTQQFCEKIKHCVIDQLQQQTITPEVEAMMMPAVNQMCDEMSRSFMQQAMELPQDLEADVTACMDSMMALSCTAIMDGGAETPACTTLQQKSSQYQKP